MGYAKGKMGIYWDRVGTYWDMNGELMGYATNCIHFGCVSQNQVSAILDNCDKEDEPVDGWPWFSDKPGVSSQQNLNLEWIKSPNMMISALVQGDVYKKMMLLLFLFFEINLGLWLGDDLTWSPITLKHWNGAMLRRHIPIFFWV